MPAKVEGIEIFHVIASRVSHTIVSICVARQPCVNEKSRALSAFICVARQPCVNEKSRALSAFRLTYASDTAWRFKHLFGFSEILRPACMWRMVIMFLLLFGLPSWGRHKIPVPQTTADWAPVGGGAAGLFHGSPRRGCCHCLLARAGGQCSDVHPTRRSDAAGECAFARHRTQQRLHALFVCCSGPMP